MVIFGVLHLVALVLGGVLFAMFLRSDSTRPGGRRRRRGRGRRRRQRPHLRQAQDVARPAASRCPTPSPRPCACAATSGWRTCARARCDVPPASRSARRSGGASARSRPGLRAGRLAADRGRDREQLDPAAGQRPLAPHADALDDREAGRRPARPRAPVPTRRVSASCIDGSVAEDLDRRPARLSSRDARARRPRAGGLGAARRAARRARRRRRRAPGPAGRRARCARSVPGAAERAREQHARCRGRRRRRSRRRAERRGRGGDGGARVRAQPVSGEVVARELEEALDRRPPGARAARPCGARARRRRSRKSSRQRSGSSGSG